MKDVGIFLGKLGWRVLTVIGVVPMAQSRPMKFLWSSQTRLWHSPPLSFSRKWLPIMMLLVVLGVATIQEFPFFENARQLVLRKPDDYWAHLRLAEAAVLASDYTLATKELNEVDRLLALGNDEDVLGTRDDVESVRKLVFPEKSLKQEITQFEQTVKKRPNSRDSALRLALLYWRLGETTKANDYLSLARQLDPNNVVVQAVAKLLED